jgi:hypothetical protein
VFVIVVVVVVMDVGYEDWGESGKGRGPDV